MIAILSDPEPSVAKENGVEEPVLSAAEGTCVLSETCENGVL
jgi:hypothetical protein